MTAGLFELAVVILLAAFLGFIAKILRQPLIIAYLATGAVIGYFGFVDLTEQTAFHFFSDLGIMFLLFLVGLEINYSSLKLVGKTSFIVGIGQVIFTSLLGYFIALALGFDPMASIYIAIALSFSSTIIVVKLLSEKRELNSLYGKISVGFLLVQDFVAILILLGLSGLAPGGEVDWLALGMTILKGLGLFALMLWLGRKVLPFVFDRVARSSELLFIISLAWVFLLAALVSRIGFSIEIAGFLAGLALANSSEHYQIAQRIRPLRDFFILVFFVMLGASSATADFTGLGLATIVFSLFVLIGNPIIVLIIMGTMRYRRRTSFLTGLAVAQISEFSLVLAAMGAKVGHLDESAVALVTAVGIATITVSSYMIIYGNGLYRRFSGMLRIFERRHLRREHNVDIRRKEIILIGAHRTGESIAMNLSPDQVLVIDFDPEVIGNLSGRGYECIFGDITDPEVFEEANFPEAKLVISTSPDLQDNLTLLETLNQMDLRPKVILRAENEEEAKFLYTKGADYVLLPHFTSGQYLGKTLALDPDAQILEHLREKDLEVMMHQHGHH
jgi:Kef-type K+ transport system membrane component KefB